MNTNEIVKESDKLGLSEKLILVEGIWDNIAQSNDKLPMPEWQNSKLYKRDSDFRYGKLKLHNGESVHDELRNKYK